MLNASARELVMAHGWNSTAYQILNPGIDHWFSRDTPGVVGYTRRSKVMLVAGAPICASAAMPGVAAEFEGFARSQGCRVCYVCAESRLHRLFNGSRGHSIVALGAQPAWQPENWPRLIAARNSLRAQINRARNRGVTIETIPAEHGRDDPGITAVLDEWLGGRALAPLHFLVEANALGGIAADRVLLAARRAERTVAFLIASPIAARNGYLIEQIARSASAPNGTTEMLIDAAMRRFAHEGRDFVTLGLVALAVSARAEIRGNPLWIRLLMRFARAHANRLYNFQGLERFRTRMMPSRWEPIYAISNEPRFSIRTLCAIGEAFSHMPPWRTIGLGAIRAIRQECHRFIPAVRPI